MSDGEIFSKHMAIIKGQLQDAIATISVLQVENDILKAKASVTIGDSPLEIARQALLIAEETCWRLKCAYARALERHKTDNNKG